MSRNYRPLTYDEKKAAEAAFNGLPFDSMWSEAGRKVYWGLCSALAKKHHKTLQEMSSFQPLSAREVPHLHAFQLAK